MNSAQQYPRRFVPMTLLLGLGLSLNLGCKDLSGTPLPTGTVSPGLVQNAAGAKQIAVAAEVDFQNAFATYITVSGELTDELQANERDDAVASDGSLDVGGQDAVVDARLLDQQTVWTISSWTPRTNAVYTMLQQTRGTALQSIGNLTSYAPDSTMLRARMYALLGYTEVMLADLYCSGIPLSLLNPQGGYTYSPGLTTNQVYTDAIAKFDTALTLAADSGQIANLTRVGLGRAYLAMGQYASAGQAVSTVPSAFQFVDSIQACTLTCPIDTSATVAVFNWTWPQDYSVSDREGGTGLPYISSGDPRTTASIIGTSDLGTYNEFFPNKYSTDGVDAFVLASGLEAQLITAEADLNAQNPGGAFAILNTLRTTNSVTAGKLPPLTDPGTLGAELDTLFTERAAWLFVDGHRQGDLRRLVRNYVNGQNLNIVANQYPSGPYPGFGSYGGSIDAPEPSTELANPLFTGCLSRD